MGESGHEAERILVVDDEEPIRRALGRVLDREGHRCTLAADAGEAHRLLDEGPFSLILSDVNMPGESGMELLRHVLTEHRDVAAVMVTGVDDPRLARMALELGAYGYVIKPFEANEVVISAVNALRRRRLEIDQRAQRERLEEAVRERTAELARAHQETIHRLAVAAEYRDDETGQHVQRMSDSCALLARLAGLPLGLCEMIRITSPMHDIGKIGIPDAVLLKPGRLTPEEFETMKRHAAIGHDMLAGSRNDLLDLAATIAWTHHERFDGRGYPRGLAGEAIPIAGRIAAVADVFDALTSPRPYKEAFPVDKAVGILLEGRGTHFDAVLLDVFLSSLDDVLAIRRRYASG
ncbi:MAG: response regulator [Deltaproteobacteria bacterium]|nr:response regulator [Deltaproteobacteria bacterium]